MQSATLFFRPPRVAPKFRRKGIGKAMIEWVIAHAKKRKISRVFCSVYKSNAAMRRLCKKYGFFESKPVSRTL